MSDDRGRSIDELEKVKIKQKICENLAQGLNRTASVDDAGIDYVTYSRWIKDDQAFAAEVLKSRAAYARTLVPLAAEKEPYKMLKSMYPQEYTEEPQLQINIDNRQLIQHPSSKLLELLDADGIRQNTDQE